MITFDMLNQIPTVDDFFPLAIHYYVPTPSTKSWRTDSATIKDLLEYEPVCQRFENGQYKQIQPSGAVLVLGESYTGKSYFVEQMAKARVFKINEHDAWRSGLELPLLKTAINSSPWCRPICLDSAFQSFSAMAGQLTKEGLNRTWGLVLAAYHTAAKLRGRLLYIIINPHLELESSKDNLRQIAFGRASGWVDMDTRTFRIRAFGEEFSLDQHPEFFSGTWKDKPTSPLKALLGLPTLPVLTKIQHLTELMDDAKKSGQNIAAAKYLAQIQEIKTTENAKPLVVKSWGSITDTDIEGPINPTVM